MFKKSPIKKESDFLDTVATSVGSNWGKGYFQTNQGEPHCIIGHLDFVKAEFNVPTHITDNAQTRLLNVIKTPYSLMGWNDQQSRRRGDVIEAVHRAAFEARQEGK